MSFKITGSGVDVVFGQRQGSTLLRCLQSTETRLKVSPSGGWRSVLTGSVAREPAITEIGVGSKSAINFIEIDFSLFGLSSPQNLSQCRQPTHITRARHLCPLTMPCCPLSIQTTIYPILNRIRIPTRTLSTPLVVAGEAFQMLTTIEPLAQLLGLIHARTSQMQFQMVVWPLFLLRQPLS